MSEREQPRAKAVQSELGTDGSSLLPYWIELWERDNQAVERILARTSSADMARAVFAAACLEHPGRRITLRMGDDILQESGG